ncbi:hypothetical protein AGABI1DRAFT_129739 [Agaricus bisporus var. burnettii JB137-S8]|uniref:Mucoidy inhibitor A n=1 Tax=Agaricus bisporus var. burnettii (strain JB137-S8 / ATCC MYA-4627 / FGSC 10392) TaxID=597362 RepID=K5XSL2_AGABU|nr:uncharacterized protein AGABI1DRAFT_129739 [Agaricus bisporus var. burnettii JB137-S8]EKM77950.1 hypothetical protein AGABI1DRAFT_129739 [Agaricus bisporus var. burnettii JB137-S8]
MSSIQTIRIKASEHPVKSVVVLKSSKAEIVRTFNVALQGGQNKIVISKLSSTIDTASVRISGFNPGNGTYLSDVVCSILDGSDDLTDGPIRALETRKAYLVREKKVLDTQAEVLVKYSSSLDGTQASPDVMTKFLNAFVAQGKTNIQAVVKVEEEIAEINKQIEAEQKKATLLKGSAHAEITAVVTADNDTRVTLKLMYIVNETNWLPTYELHALTGDDGRPSQTVSLHYRATVAQTTGEDWTDASLTLSTVATDAIVKTIPKSNPAWIRVTYANLYNPAFRQQPLILPFAPRQSMPAKKMTATFVVNHEDLDSPMVQMSSVPEAAPTFGSGNAAARNDETDLGVIPFPDGDEDEEGTNYGDEERPAKLVNQTPMALSYTVQGKSSIPSDGKNHVVTIAVLSFETSIDYISVPKVEPRVYLQCQVKNNSEYRLLPGPVSVILDDNYVSKTTIADVNRNDVFYFTLGDDPSILVSYARVSKVTKEGSGSFADVANITTYTTTIKVENKRPFSIDNLIIRNALPVTQDNRVRVVLRKPKELIEAKEGVLVKVKGEETTEEEGEEKDDKYPKVKWTKEKTGLYEYHWRVDADEEIQLESIFEMKASADLHCVFD